LHIYPPCLAEILGFFWVTCAVEMMSLCHESLLTLTATTNWFLYPHWTYSKCLSTLICCSLAYVSSLKQLYSLHAPLGLGVSW
jgi:hypothetical protein